MSIRRILTATAIISVFVAGAAWAQEAPAAKKRTPLRNSTPRVAKQRPTHAPEFGGVNIQYQRISAAQFTSDVSVDSYTSTWNPPSGTDYQRSFDADGFNHFVSSPTLPGGARIVYVEFDACDSSTIDEHVTLTVWNCDFEGFCDATPMTTLTTVSDVANPCTDYSDSAISQRVNNFFGQTLLDIQMDAFDGTNSFSGVIIGYLLEVEPAPAIATFLDVPITDPAFQFIEALVAAGVTAGCGGGNYCPDATVTRRQMAVFMSKLNGLAWNGF